MKLSKQSMRAIKAKAKAKGITEGEAANLLIATATKRQTAVARYAEKSKRKAKPAKRKPAKKATAAKPRPKPKAARKPAKPRVRKPKTVEPEARGATPETSELN